MVKEGEDIENYDINILFILRLEIAGKTGSEYQRNFRLG